MTALLRAEATRPILPRDERARPAKRGAGFVRPEIDDTPPRLARGGASCISGIE